MNVCVREPPSVLHTYMCFGFCIQAHLYTHGYIHFSIRLQGLDFGDALPEDGSGCRAKVVVGVHMSI